MAAIGRLSKCASYDKMVSLKMKTRLFIVPGYDKAKPKQKSEILSKFVRCMTCNSCLLEDVAVSNFDDNLVLNDYEP